MKKKTAKKKRAAASPPKKKARASKAPARAPRAAPARKKAAKKVAKKKAPAKRVAPKRPSRAKASPPKAKKSSSPKGVRAPRELEDEWVHHAAPKRHGIDPEAKRAKHQVIFLSPLTRKPVKRARKGQKVLYGHIDTAGELHVLHDEPQSADPTLKTWIERTLRNRPKSVLFVQKSKEVVRPPKAYKPTKHEKIIRGVLHRKKPRGKEWEPVHYTKLARPTSAKKQQPVAYQAGKTRPVEPGMVKHTRTELASLRTPKWVPTGKTLDIPVTGATIYESLKNIVLDKELKRLKPFQEVYYQYVVVYRDPRTGEKVTIPGRGKHLGTHVSARPAQLAGLPPGTMVATDRISRSAFSPAAQIARSIRLSLAESGVRFSSLYTLEEVKEEMEGRIDEATEAGNSRKAGQLARGLVGLEYLHAVQYGGRVTRGTKMSSLTPLRPERADGRMYQNIPGALAVKLRLTIVDNAQRRAEYETAKEKKKGGKRGRK